MPTRSPKSLTIWYALMFATGFCSMIYELALAQLLGGLVGNVMMRFAPTLGVYVVGLGLGSVAFKPRDDARDGRLFLSAELALFFVGLTSPLLFVALYRTSSVMFDEPASRSLFVLITTHIVIFVTGFLAGFELPILSALANRRGADADAPLLASDYVGMFAASLLFPLVLFPLLGLAPSFWLATLTNLIAAGVTYFAIGGRRPSFVATVGVLFLVNLTALAFSTDIQLWLSRLYAQG